MARESRTDYVILGTLAIEPMSGYDIRSFVEGTIGHFWHESYGQIYPALKRLAKEGYVTCTVEKQDGRPDRKVYQITADGQKRLRDWLAVDYEPQPVRHELLLKMFFAPAADKRLLLDQIEREHLFQQEKLANLEQLRELFLGEFEKDPSHPWWFATLNYGLHITRARISWCEETLASLRSVVRE